MKHKTTSYKKYIIAFFVLACALMGAFLRSSTQSQASGAYTIISVTAEDIADQGAYTAIQDALNTARKYATEDNPYKIIVAAGTYKISSTLHIYSNTYLILSGVTLKQCANYNMLIVGRSNDSHTGYYYKNITIKGGKFDANGYPSTLMKVCHTSGFTMTGTVLKNTKNGHLMEIAGVKDVTISDCTFKDQIITKTSVDDLRYEAIQIDILTKYHMVGYRYQDVANKNITITGCTFTNVPRGIGSHTTVLNNPVNGITITNNTFTKCKSAAIQGMNWINCTISNNTIKRCTRGIALYSIRSEGVYLSSTLSKQGSTTSKTSTSYKAPKTNQNIVIEDNDIAISGTDPYAVYEKAGISVIGYVYTTSVKPSSTKYGNTIPAGDYYISGVTITGNSITGTGAGIRLSNTRNATIRSNTISYSKDTPSSKYNGIYVSYYSSNVAISGNSITGMLNGIKLTNATISSVKDNVVKDCRNDGIRLTSGAVATTIANNSITDIGDSGISITGKSTSSNITSNTIEDSGEACINILSYTTNLTIKSNILLGGDGSSIIYIAPSTTDASLKVNANTVYASLDQIGIEVNKACTIAIKDNTILGTLSPFSISSKATVSYAGNTTELTED